MILACLPVLAVAETLRIATFAAPLSRDGPGLLLRDLIKADDPQIGAVVANIKAVRPDVLVLTDFDYDQDGLALAAFSALFDGLYPHYFAARPNTGMFTGLDMDRNGRKGEPRDAQGYGRFAGDGGMAVLSRFAIGDTRDLSGMLWRELPGATLPVADGAPFLTDEVLAVQRLSSSGHWIVPIDLPDGPLTVLAFSATPPVFDGPEDRNGLRNRDELRLWDVVLNGDLGPIPDGFVVAGNANLDPLGGDGLRAAMAAFLARPDLQDPLPGQPTADWRDRGIGTLRVSYVLPAWDWQVQDAGVMWPDTQQGDDPLVAGPHHLVWVDIAR
ncbi:endonuclease/exonuclease/phosphatase family protein [Yoonia sp.]|uniref:endonuclease/exonuclease/phosphatase family protein n=1 Tax=Yoonia sp. TaxID=2212373 RepID=UPI003F6C58A3